MKRSLLILAAAVLSLGIPGIEGRGEAPPEGDFSLLWSEDFALLKATEAPVNAVLTAIGRAAGIPMALDEQNEETVSLDLFFEINEIDDVERLILAVWPSTVVTYEAKPDSDGYLIAGVKTTARVDSETTRATRAANQQAAARTARTSATGRTASATPGTADRDTMRGLLDQLRAAREAGNTDRVNQLMPQIREVASRVREAEQQARAAAAQQARERGGQRR